MTIFPASLCALELNRLFVVAVPLRCIYVNELHSDWPTRIVSFEKCVLDKNLSHNIILYGRI